MRHLLFFFAAALFLNGCGGETKTAEVPKPAEAPPPDPASNGSILGKVTFSGEKPASKPLNMDANQHKGPIDPGDVIVGKSGELKNVFVYVKAGLPQRQWAAPQTPVEIDQKACIYSPRVVGVMVGQDLAISNNDPTMHNVHPLPKNNREWNTSQAPKGEKLIKQFEKEEVMIAFKCNVHPWMRAYVGVLSHPFFAVTGEDGSFSIKDLPPGEYTLEAWHEKLGTRELKLTVAAKESKTADIAFKR
jgi:plastocyanin